MEEYSIVEDAEEGGTDVTVSVSLKQYRSYGVKTCTVKTKKKLRINKLRKTKGIHIKVPKGWDYILFNNCYQIKVTKKITVYNLAKKIYGSGEMYADIIKANTKPWKKSTELKKGVKVLVPLNYYK